LSTLIKHEDDADAEEAATLPAALKATLARRVHTIIVRSQVSSTTDPASFLATLTDLEQRLFWTGHRYAQERAAWRMGLHARITAVPSAMGAGAAAAAAGPAGRRRIGDQRGGAGKASAVPELRSVTGVGYKRKRTAMM